MKPNLGMLLVVVLLVIGLTAWLGGKLYSGSGLNQAVNWPGRGSNA